MQIKGILISAAFGFNPMTDEDDKPGQEYTYLIVRCDNVPVHRGEVVVITEDSKQ